MTARFGLWACLSAMALALAGTSASAQNLEVRGTTTGVGDAVFVNNVDVDGTLRANGNANVAHDLTVTGTATAQNVTVSGAVAVGGALTVGASGLRLDSNGTVTIPPPGLDGTYLKNGTVTQEKLAAPPPLVGAARVNADGTIAFQSGGIGVTRTAAGRYTITFAPDNWPGLNKVFLSATVVSDLSGQYCGTCAPMIFADVTNWTGRQASVTTRYLWANYYNGSGANASITDRDQNFWIVAHRVP